MNKNDKEDYPGDVASYEGKVPLWLILVFSALIIWAIVYFFENWGGFGPAYQP
jgi:hypothetical protein